MENKGIFFCKCGARIDTEVNILRKIPELKIYSSIYPPKQLIIGHRFILKLKFFSEHCETLFL